MVNFLNPIFTRKETPAALTTLQSSVWGAHLLLPKDHVLWACGNDYSYDDDDDDSDGDEY